MCDLRKSAFKGVPPRRGNPQLSVQKVNYAPLKWQDYFDTEEFVDTPSGKHHIYVKGQGSKGPIILCLHGGGYNGLTWALLAKEMHQNLECQIIAIDFRGHGNTTTENEDDLSLETLTQDVIDVANTLAERERKSIVLIGHSMGGAIAVNASYKIDSLVAICVIDVVEGTALDALSSMQSILRGRPTKFESIPQAIQWCYKGGQSHNLEAARVSMPGQIINSKTKVLASDEWETFEQLDGTNLGFASVSHSRRSEHVLEETDEDASEELRPPVPLFTSGKDKSEFSVPTMKNIPSPEAHYSWRIDLSRTEQYWTQWFQGLSDKFLGCKVPKILLLANIHGLDTKLTVGQMQGKFQLQVLAKSGHAVHEDQPHKVAEILSIYLAKQKCAETKADFPVPMYPNVSC